MRKIILFDLDGTLIDTSIDITNALNATLNHYNKSSKNIDAVRPTIGGGLKEIISHGFGIHPSDPNFNKIIQHCLTAYSQNIAKNTDLYPGMKAFLKTLTENDFDWGIVTNKPEWLTYPLLEELKLNNETACIICGDSLPVKKPHPLPLQYACLITDSTPSHAVFIGDTKTDITAANAAKIKSIAVTYGYRYPEDDPSLWQADSIVHHANELWPIVSNIKFC